MEPNIEYVDSNIFVILLFIFMGQSERLWKKGKHVPILHGSSGDEILIERLDGTVFSIDKNRTRPI